MTTKHAVEFASDLNLRPGQWPVRLDYAGLAYYRHSRQDGAEGELASVTYVRQERGERLELVVFND